MEKIKNIKAIVLDLDGTLLSSNLKILEQTQKVLQQLIQDGIRVIIATGRTPQTAIPMTKELNIKAPMVLANGALIYDPVQNKIINSNNIQKSTVNALLKLSKNINKSLNIYTLNRIYLEQDKILAYMNESGDKKENLLNHTYLDLDKEIVLKCEFFGPNDGKNAKLKEIVIDQSNKLNEDLYITSAHIDFLEILNKNVNKFHGIQYVLNFLDIKSNEVLLFGDSHNDVEMLDNFPYSIAMANGEDCAKKVAKFSTTSNNDNGILNFIEKYTTLIK